MSKNTKEGDRCPSCNHYNAMLHDSSRGEFVCRDCGYAVGQKEDGRTCSLFIEGESWVYQDESLESWFGTDKVPTAYPSTASGGYVIARIKELNPEADLQYVCFGCIATTPLCSQFQRS